MKPFFPHRKVEKIVKMSQNSIKGTLTLRDLTKLLGKLTASIQTIIPAKLQVHFLQKIQTEAMRKI